MNTPLDSQTLLQLEGVGFTYRALPVVRGLDWQWRRGEQWACLGPNGAGKTTVAKLLSRQLQPGSGNIYRAQQLQHGIAYVCFEQQKALCDRDQHMDDSEFRADARDPGTTVQAAILAGRPRNANFEQWARRLQVEHVLERGIRFISTGEMRKTLLLRAILSEPALLVLDSPLDGLDRNSQLEMQAVIDQLLHSPMHLFLLCRDLEDIPEGITHILALEEGEIAAAGAREDVLNQAAVQKLMNPPPPGLKALPEPGERPYLLQAGEPLLELHQVSVSYGNNAVLRDVEWTLRPGQHCSISGPNGCGKTTLLSLVNGDNHKAYGQDITLFGIPRGSGESVWDIKQKYGVVNTQLHLNHVRGMKVVEVVVSGFFDTIGLYDDWGDQQKQTACQWLDALGLGEYKRQPFDTLSFGLQRMVLLARAMVKSPIILILDEPCLGLDGHHRRTILRAIDHIAANSDTQVLYVSHSAGEAPACINQQLVFEPGEDVFELRCIESAHQTS